MHKRLIHYRDTRLSLTEIRATCVMCIKECVKASTFVYVLSLVFEPCKGKWFKMFFFSFFQKKKMKSRKRNLLDKTVWFPRLLNAWSLLIRKLFLVSEICNTFFPRFLTLSRFATTWYLWWHIIQLEMTSKIWWSNSFHLKLWRPLLHWKITIFSWWLLALSFPSCYYRWNYFSIIVCALRKWHLSCFSPWTGVYVYVYVCVQNFGCAWNIMSNIWYVIWT